MGNLQLWLRAQWDRIAGVALIAAGGLLLVIGYWGVSGSPFVAEQLSYVISGGMDVGKLRSQTGSHDGGRSLEEITPIRTWLASLLGVVGQDSSPLVESLLKENR